MNLYVQDCVLFVKKYLRENGDCSHIEGKLRQPISFCVCVPLNIAYLSTDKAKESQRHFIRVNLFNHALLVLNLKVVRVQIFF